MKKAYKTNNLKLTLSFAATMAFFVITAFTFGIFYKNKISSLKPTGAKASTETCTLTFTIPSPTPIRCTTPVDIVGISIDRSSSMTQLETDGRTKLVWAKEAVSNLIKTLQSSGVTNVRISINSFGAQGNFSQGATGTHLLASPGFDSLLHTPLTNNYSTLLTAVNNIKYIKYGTCIQCGLRLSNKQIASTSNKKIAILLSDGRANHNWDGSTSNAGANAISEANTGRTKGVSYHVIGYGTSGNINETTLRAIAGTTGSYQYKPNAYDWSQTFLNIINSACTLQ